VLFSEYYVANLTFDTFARTFLSYHTVLSGSLYPNPCRAALILLLLCFIHASPDSLRCFPELASDADPS
jgi:hypothetical protein